VTIQAQVLLLLKQLQKTLNLAILLITHDLGVVAQMADEVVVMYLGRVVESGSVRAILKKPRHPYTIGLLESLPSLTPIGQRLPSIRGSVPALTDLPPGCPFHPRCAYAVPGRCNVGAPPPLEALPDQRFVACWRTREVALERLLQRKGEPAGSAGRDSRAPESAVGAGEAAVPVSASAAVLSPELADGRAEAEWFDSEPPPSDSDSAGSGRKEPA